MNTHVKKEYCFWYVAPWKGQVKKVRISRRKVVLCGFLMGALFSSLLFIAGDYFRIQWLRSRSHISLEAAFDQRNRLVEDKNSLVHTVQTLRHERHGVLSMQEEMKKRMEELGSILSEASAFGLDVQEKDQALVLERNAQDLGGLETPCDTSGRCDDDLPPQSLALGQQHVPSDNTADLFQVFDDTLMLLQKLPLASPANGHVNSRYGKRISPFSRRIKMHRGLDFSLPYGSPIVASGDGTVVSVKRTSTYGLVVDIQHTDKVVTRYAHLSSALVKEGESVCRGERIALVGSSGRSTGPHLHYEIRVDGKTIDPDHLLKLGIRLARLFY